MVRRAMWFTMTMMLSQSCWTAARMPLKTQRFRTWTSTWAPSKWHSMWWKKRMERWEYSLLFFSLMNQDEWGHTNEKETTSMLYSRLEISWDGCLTLHHFKEMWFFPLSVFWWAGSCIMFGPCFTNTCMRTHMIHIFADFRGLGQCKRYHWTNKKETFDKPLKKW